MELVGDPLPDVGRTQPYHHRRPRHQHRHLCSIGKQQLTMIGNLKKKKLQVWYCPNASERPPWPATLAAAVGLFLYQSLDAIDGKQARRTGTSSPLGELFDHGCDSLSTGLLLVKFSFIIICCKCSDTVLASDYF